mgnify:CR=1 FL=1
MDKRVGNPRRIWNSFLKLRSSLPSLVVESVMITFGVLLAFAFDSWKVENKLERDTTTVLQNLKSELLSNRSILLEWVAYHDSLIVRFDEISQSKSATTQFIGKSSLEVLYPEPSISYLLQSTAWQTAHSTQVIRYFKYRTTYNLTHGYESQDEIEKTRTFLFTKLHEQARTEEPYKKTHRIALNSLFQELSDQEHYLLSVYRDALIEVDRELADRSG